MQQFIPTSKFHVGSIAAVNGSTAPVDPMPAADVRYDVWVDVGDGTPTQFTDVRPSVRRWQMAHIVPAKPGDLCIAIEVDREMRFLIIELPHELPKCPDEETPRP